MDKVKEELFEVTLKKPHTHQGVLYKEGDKIKLTAFEVEFLQANGVI